MHRNHTFVLFASLLMSCATAYVPEGGPNSDGVSADASNIVPGIDARPGEPDARPSLPGQPDAGFLPQADAQTPVVQTPDAAPICGGTGGVLANGTGDAVDSGMMFDVNVLAPVTIDSIDTVLYSASTTQHNVELYYRLGSFGGHETNSNSWSLAGSAQVTSSGADEYTSVPVSIDLDMAAGETVSFYITSTGGATVWHRAGWSDGNVYSEDGNIQITDGPAVSYPFGASQVQPARRFAGRVHYSCP